MQYFGAWKCHNNGDYVIHSVWYLSYHIKLEPRIIYPTYQQKSQKKYINKNEDVYTRKAYVYTEWKIKIKYNFSSFSDVLSNEFILTTDNHLHQISVLRKRILRKFIFIKQNKIVIYLPKYFVHSANNLLILCRIFIDNVKNEVFMMAGEKARRQLHKNATCNLKQVLAATPQKTPTVRPPTLYHENYSS